MKKFVGLFVCALMASVAMAQVVKVKGADGSAALRIYNGYTGTLSVAVLGSGTQLTVTCDGNVNTITGTGSDDTIAELEVAIAACTNAAGEKKLSVDSAMALAADSTDLELLTGTYTATAGNWATLLWDTSVHLSYDLYFPTSVMQPGQGAYEITSIQGQPTGTGNVTLSIYIDRVLVDQQVYVSPVYVNAASWISAGSNASVTNANVADAIVNLNYKPNGLRCTGAQPVIIRAARATTATTGIISATVK